MLNSSKDVEAARRRLDEARDQLAAVKSTKDGLVATEAEAAATSEAYVEWRRQTAVAEVEFDRLTTLVARREGELQAAQEAEAQAAQAEVEAAFERDAQVTGKLIVDNLAKMTKLARETVAAIANSELKRATAQANRSKDLPPLRSAEDRVRSTTALPRLVINEEVVTRWVFTKTANVITDPEQAAKVSPRGDGKTGFIVSHSGGVVGRVVHNHPVHLQAFRKITYHPPIAEKIGAGELMRELRIPGLRSIDPPGWHLALNFPSPRDLLTQIERLTAAEKAGPRREVIEELQPIDDASLARRAIDKIAGIFQSQQDDAEGDDKVSASA